MNLFDVALASQLVGGGGGGSSLPSVQSADHGSVLQVNKSGEWARGVSLYERNASPNTLIAEQTVTTVIGDMGYPAATLSLEKLNRSLTRVDVVFEGTSYSNVPFTDYYIGETSGPNPDYTNYPFFIELGFNQLWTAAEGTYTVSAKVHLSNQITPTIDFTNALIGQASPIYVEIMYDGSDLSINRLDRFNYALAELYADVLAGKLVIGIDRQISTSARFFPMGDHIGADFIYFNHNYNKLFLYNYNIYSNGTTQRITRTYNLSSLVE